MNKIYKRLPECYKNSGYCKSSLLKNSLFKTNLYYYISPGLFLKFIYFDIITSSSNSYYINYNEITEERIFISFKKYEYQSDNIL